MNSLSVGGSLGVPEGQIEVVTSTIVANTAQPDEECVMDVQVWVQVRTLRVLLDGDESVA